MKNYFGDLWGSLYVFGLERYKGEVLDIKDSIYGLLNDYECMKFFLLSWITPLLIRRGSG